MMTTPTPPAETPAQASATATLSVRVWDLPTRAFHGALVAVVAGAIVTGEIGEPWMAWHFRCGEAALALLMFRLAWGVVGGRWSRFSAFPPSPARAARHLRGRPAAQDPPGVGHNPLGALSVWAMLALLLAQVATGLLADDEVSVTGPLNHLVGGHAARVATRWHTFWGLDAIFGLLALHVLAVGWHVLRRREPLLRAMWTGDKPAPRGTPASQDTALTRGLALGILLLAAAAVAALIARFGG